jgi:hypothetical protein
MEEKGRSRKRQRQPEKWIVNECKKRNSGKVYVSRHTKKDVPARTIGDPCTCRRKSFEKLGMDVIEQSFCNFWGIEDYNVQSSFLSQLLSWDDRKVTKVMSRPSRKLRTIRYSVLVNGEKKTICRQAFFSVHGITEKRVRSVVGKQSLTATTELDCRGKDIPRSKISSERKALVKQHTESVATVSSHYSRGKAHLKSICLQIHQ